jgi:hypothetical protein
MHQLLPSKAFVESNAALAHVEPSALPLFSQDQHVHVESRYAAVHALGSLSHQHGNNETCVALLADRSLIPGGAVASGGHG